MSIKTDEFEADLERLSASLSAHRPIDPQLKERIRRRSQQLGEARYEQRGYLDVAVSLIREIRDE